MAYISFQPKDYFATKLYSGTGSSNAITNLGFSPTWVWIKSRSAGEGHGLFDQLRGVNVRLQSHSTSAQSTQTDSLASFDSDGFTVGGSSNNDAVNGSGQNFVSWNWKANGAGSSNTDGSITSTVSANTTSGFSIVKYNGNSSSSSTIGHGLGVTPSVILLKNAGQAENWVVFHKELGATHYLELNSTAGDNSGGEIVWYDTLPTSSLFTIGNSGKVNGGSPYAHVAYCFADKQGHFKGDKYFGNGSADGTFVYTGMKISWLMIKRADASGDSWLILDTKRQGYNGGSGSTQGNLNLIAEGSSSEGNETLLDIYSNGFKIRTSDAKINGSGNKYIYMCFADEPLVSSNGVPTCAR